MADPERLGRDRLRTELVARELAEAGIALCLYLTDEQQRFETPEDPPPWHGDKVRRDHGSVRCSRRTMSPAARPSRASSRAGAVHPGRAYAPHPHVPLRGQAHAQADSRSHAAESCRCPRRDFVPILPAHSGHWHGQESGLTELKHAVRSDSGSSVGPQRSFRRSFLGARSPGPGASALSDPLRRRLENAVRGTARGQRAPHATADRDPDRHPKRARHSGRCV